MTGTLYILPTERNTYGFNTDAVFTARFRYEIYRHPTNCQVAAL